MTEPTCVPDDPFAPCVYCGTAGMNEAMRPHLTPTGLNTRWLECIDPEACRARTDDCVYLYHRTSAELALHVLSHGFTGVDFIGDVLLADSPANAEKNMTGCAIIEVTIDHERRLTTYEHTPEDQWFRTWLVPTYLINNHGQVRLLTDDEAHDAYIEARSRAEDATAEMFFREAQQEAADAWEEAEQSIDLDDLLANGQV